MTTSYRFGGFAVALLVGLTAPVLAAAQSDADILHDLGHFFESANVVSGPSLVDCTLSGGTETRCFSITLMPDPGSYTPGPWCPTSGEDGAEVSGIWLEGGAVHDADGSFMANLSSFYNDAEWQMVDPETGAINVTTTPEQCAAAANPNVGPEFKNFCVECRPEFLDPDTTVTYVIPLGRFDLETPADNRFAGAGVAFNGVRLDAPAPVDAILGAYTIAPFDDCGGHVNPFVGYHYHAVTDCLSNGAQSDSHGARVGIAMDGYLIFSKALADGAEPTGLDICNGHETEGLDYHYHAGDPGANAILGCLKAEYGCALSDANGTCDASKRPPRPE